MAFMSYLRIRIHAVCRKNYTRKCSILSAKRKSSCLEEDEDVTQLRSSTTKTFDIRNDCMFCSEPITQDSRNPSCRKGSVSSVETLEFQATVLDRARERGDKLGNDVSDRVQHAYDLVAAEAKYHRACAQSFLKKKSEGMSTGSILQQAISEAM